MRCDKHGMTHGRDECLDCVSIRAENESKRAEELEQQLLNREAELREMTQDRDAIQKQYGSAFAQIFKVRSECDKALADYYHWRAECNRAIEFIRTLILAHKATKSEDHYQITGDARRFVGMD